MVIGTQATENSMLLPQANIRRSARLINEMTQMSSAIIVAVKCSMEYAKLCMGMHLGNARLPASPRDRKRVARRPFIVWGRASVWLLCPDCCRFL